MSGNLAHNLEAKTRTEDILIEGNLDFNSLLLSSATLLGLTEAGFYKPSPVQIKAIPLGRCGLDLIVQAKSGTGKTVVFTVLALEMVQTDQPDVQVLVLAPTREIAVQIEDVIKTVGKPFSNLKVGSFIGGLPVEEDIKKLKECHVAVGAPGRLKHLVEAGKLQTDKIRLLVFDEADKLMEKSFQHDINFIYHKLSERKQVLALSATYTKELQSFLANYMQSPTFVTPDSKTPVLLGLKQFVLIVKSHLNITRQMAIKNEELVRILSKVSFTQCLVFFNTQCQAEGVSNILNKDGWNTIYISSGQSQNKRLQAVSKLKKMESKIFLSTDLTARGIDAANVDLIINYDVPYQAATYLHRMGRAGRYGSVGVCITIASEPAELEKLQKLLGEIGGAEFGITKLGPDNLQDIWSLDLNLQEKVFGILGSHSETEQLKNSVLDLKRNNVNTKKKKSKTSNIEESMTNNLKKLSMGESTNQKQNEIIDIKNTLDSNHTMQNKLQEEFVKVDAESLLQNLAAGIVPLNAQDVENHNLKKFMEDKQMPQKELNQKITEVDTESLLKKLAAGIVLSKSQEIENHNLNNFLQANQMAENELNQKFPEVDTESLLKNLAAGQVPSAAQDDEDTTMDDKEGISAALLYPWVPVEGAPVLTVESKGESLLSSDEKAIEASPVQSDRKRKRAGSPDSNPVLVKNIALYNISRLLTDDSVSVLDLTMSIYDYLNLIKQDRKSMVENLLNLFGPHSCEELLKNIVEFTEQIQKQSESKPGASFEDIFKLSYSYMVNDSPHWARELGIELEPEEAEDNCIAEENNDAQEDMQVDENQEIEDAILLLNGHSSGPEHSEENRLFNDVSSYRAQQEIVSGVPSEHANRTYVSYFDHYREMLENDGPTFECESGFNDYFSQWQQQVGSVRDFVQQNIYLQEMNNYQYYTNAYNYQNYASDSYKSDY